MKSTPEIVQVRLKCRTCNGAKQLYVPGKLWWHCWKWITCFSCDGKGHVIVSVERPKLASDDGCGDSYV